ncbi:hypothetical protein SLEP1_g15441 [Rubroshorea leprosula]|uniref:histidine kinase n=1 Tax=Rubroshorea leprosula TaxID=152421 RepID=A0AAV5IXU4_9ROSI|nr:hypothetical protein SLEP1_g15441 [Rubroshorea leprosula]
MSTHPKLEESTLLFPYSSRIGNVRVGIYCSSSKPNLPSFCHAPCTQDSDEEQTQLPETTVWIRCDVYDTVLIGIPVTENALPTLFKTYMQVSADHARKYGGTGLGLVIRKHLLCKDRSTVKELRLECIVVLDSLPGDNSDDPDELSDVADHDAAIDDATAGFFQFPSTHLGQKEVTCLEDDCSVVEAAETFSEPGSLSSHSPDPDDENGNPDSTVIRSTSNGSLVVPDSISKPKILLVEDNKVNVMVTQSMMKQLGDTIDVVNNGVEAVRTVQSSNYDLILMDVCMPVMDGLQSTRLIRSFEEAGNWDAAAKAGIEQLLSSSNLLQNGEGSVLPTERIPIIAVSSSTCNLSN